MSSDVFISGGNYTGMILAYLLDGLGYQVTIFEKSTKKTKDIRGISLAYGTRNFLHRVKLWKDLKPYSASIDETWLSVNNFMDENYTVLKDNLYPVAYIVEGDALYTALKSKLEKTKVTWVYDSIKQIESADPLVFITQKGTTYKGDLLLVAEGKESLTRMMLDISVLRYDYEESATVCIINTKAKHGNKATQSFFKTSSVVTTLPMTKNRLNVVWTHPNTMDMALNAKDQLVQLYPYIPSFYYPFTFSETFVTYPLSLMMAYQYGKGNILLVADSAHHMHPLAGQGLNLGLRDCAELITLIYKRRYLGESLNGLLSDYESLRLLDNVAMGVSMSVFDSLLTNKRLQKPALKSLSSIRKVPGFLDLFLENAMGIQPWTPGLMKNTLPPELEGIEKMYHA